VEGGDKGRDADADFQPQNGEVEPAAAMRQQLESAMRGAHAPMAWLKSNTAGVRDAAAARLGTGGVVQNNGGVANGERALGGDIGYGQAAWQEQRQDLEQKLHAIAVESDGLRVQLQRACDSREALTLTAKSKDEQIAAVLAEGAQLSARQAEQEKALKKLRKEKEELERAVAEKDGFAARVRSLEAMNTALRKSADGSASAHELVAAKDDQIAQVLAEGDALSRKQAELERALKAQRKQLREAEVVAEKTSAKLAVSKSAIEQRDAKLKLVEAAELRGRRAGEECSNRNVALERELLDKDRAIADALTDTMAARAELDNVRRQAGHTKDLRSQIGRVAESEAVARSTLVASLVEVELIAASAGSREAELFRALKETRREAGQQADAAAWRENMFTQQLRDMHARCDSAERRAEQLVTAVPDATRPLLAQLAAALAVGATRAEAWGADEATLSARAAHFESLANEAAAKRVAAEGEAEEARTRCSAAERLAERERTSARAAEEEAASERVRASKAAASVSKQTLAFRAAAERSANAADEARAAEARARLLLEEERAAAQTSAAEAAVNLSDARTQLAAAKASANEIFSRQRAGDALPRADSRGASRGGGGLDALLAGAAGGGLDSDLAQPASAAEVEWQGAQQRQRAGELSHLNSQLRELETCRGELLGDVSLLTGRVDELSTHLKAREREAAEAGALAARHAAALELIGEQQEELDALAADLDDVKAEWRRQVLEWCPPDSGDRPASLPLT